MNMVDYNKADLLNHIISFALISNWEDENIPEQIRAFFTSWAFWFHIDADTHSCAQALGTIYTSAGLDEIISYDDYENFMVELIV